MKPCGATIREPVVLRGRDRQCRPTTVTLRPAGPDTGIWFNGTVRAAVSNASVCRHATCLGRGRTQVRMVEHLLAACYALGVTDLAVETAGAELPLLDGSAQPYVRMLWRTGILRYPAGPEPARLKQPVLVCSGRRFIAAVPAEYLALNCLVSYPGIGPQFFRFRMTANSFARDVAPARTFVRTGTSPAGLQHKLGLRFRLRRIAGLAEDGRRSAFVYPERWRLPKEPCRHKTLDLLGDFALIGRPVGAEVFAFMPGHRLNLAFAQQLERRLEA